MHRKVLGVLVSGRGSNLQAILDAINAGRLDAKIGVVVSDNPDANALRRIQGMDIPTAVVERRSFKTKAEFEAALIAQLDLHHVELVLLAGFMRILSPNFLNRFPGRVMNIHPALLPSFPGLDAQAQALAYGAKVSGCTVHFVDEGVDSGPVILQQAVQVLSDDTEDTLAKRILEQEHRLYPEAIKLWAQGRLAVSGRRVTITGEGSGV